MSTELVTSYEPHRSEQFPITVGRQWKPPEPVLHDLPKPQETAVDHARRILRLRRRQDNAIEIAEMFMETIPLLDRLWWEKNPDEPIGPVTDKKLKAWITVHPFMQYLTYLLRIRTIPMAEASYRQCENVVEGIAQL